MKKLILTTLFFAFLGLLSFAQNVQKTYYFDDPTVTEVNGYDVIKFAGTMNNGVIGEASLPWQAVSLLLPQNTEAQSITVEYYDFVFHNTKYFVQVLPIFPPQQEYITRL